MIDFHSHILPAIDDGASDMETSISMLAKSRDDGVKTIVSTSHCFPAEENSVADFLKNQKIAYDNLCIKEDKKLKDFPQIILGCELHMVDGVSKLPDLEKLCVKDTNYILLEMPYSSWTDNAYEEVYQIIRRGLRPIIAHLDRYVGQESKFHELLALNVLFQINTSAFIEGNNGKRLLTWFRNDSIHVIGSDMHNLSTRPPNLKEAYDIIHNKYGWEYVDFLMHNSDRILRNKTALPTRLPRPNIIKRMFL